MVRVGKIFLQDLEARHRSVKSVTPDMLRHRSIKDLERWVGAGFLVFEPHEKAVGEPAPAGGF